MCCRDGSCSFVLGSKCPLRVLIRVREILLNTLQGLYDKLQLQFSVLNLYTVFLGLFMRNSIFVDSVISGVTFHYASTQIVFVFV